MNNYIVTTPAGESFSVSAVDSDFAVWNANTEAQALRIPSCRASLYLVTARGNQHLGEFNLAGVDDSEVPFFTDLEQAPAGYVWSSRVSIPAIGQRVRVRVNGLGPGVVMGYQVAEGFLAVVVSVDRLPDRFNRSIKQRENVPLECFGVEIEEITN